MKNKRVISMLLVVIYVLTMLPIDKVFAIAVVDEKSFKEYVASQGWPLKSDYDRYDVNYTTWQKYGLIVYGSEHGTLRNGECRYLGYTQHNAEYTNPKFPADPGTDGSSPADWKFQDIEASSSWGDIRNVDQRNYMQTAKLSYDNYAYPYLYVGTGPKTANKVPDGTGLGTNVAKLQNMASWKNGFTVFTKFINTEGQLRYATLTGPPMASIDFKCNVSTPVKTYYIRANQDQSDPIPVTVTSNLTLTGTYANASQVQYIDAQFEDAQNSVAYATTTSVTKNKIYTRKEYAPGTHTITLDGSSHANSTLSNEDLLVAKGSNTITLIVEPPPASAYASATLNAEESKQFTGSDIPVKVTLNGQINNIPDVSKIEKVTMHMRKLPTGADDQQQNIDVAPTFTPSLTYTFTVPASKLNGVDSYTQYFEGWVEFLLKDKTKVISLYAPDSTYIFKVKTPIPEVNNIPPVPIISAVDTVEVGTTMMLNGSKSYDPDGTIASYYWEAPGATISSSTSMNTAATFNVAGTKQVILGVTDNKGAYVETAKTIKVTPPYPVAIMLQSGALKVNRKISVDAFPSWSPIGYPIDHNKTTWKITPISGGGTAADIKYSGTLTGVTKDFLIKKAGKYKVELTVTNSAGLSHTTEKMLDIAPDTPPVANFTVIKEAIRDPNDYNHAKITLVDQSYSIDGDTITKRTWKYAYDSDNDGTVADEVWRTIDATNNTSPTLVVSEVGKYVFYLEVEETFSQATMPEYMLVGDILKGNTSTKPDAEKTTEVINVKPIADVSAITVKNVDLVVASDYIGTRYTDLTSKVNAIQSELATKRVNVNVQYITESSKQYYTKMLPPSIYSVGIYLQTASSMGGQTCSIFNSSSFAGTNRYGITDAEVAQLSAGNENEVVLKKDGTMWSRGKNHWGEVVDPGSDASTYEWQFRQMTGASTNIVEIGTEPGATYALTADGNLYVAGNINDGWANPWMVQPYVGFRKIMTDVADIICEYGITYVLKKDGTVWINGTNISAYMSWINKKFNVPTTNNYLIIGYTYGFQQLAGASNIKRIFATDYSLFMINGSNQVYVAGENQNGAFGFESTYYKPPTSTVWYDRFEPDPKLCPQLNGAEIKSIATTEYETYVLKNDGTMWKLNSLVGFVQINTLSDLVYLESFNNIYDTAATTLAVNSSGTMYSIRTPYANPSTSVTYNLSYGNVGGMYDVYNTNINALKTLTLRPDADRILLLAADGAGEGYAAGYGKHFTFLKVDADLDDYLQSKNFRSYLVADPAVASYKSLFAQSRGDTQKLTLNEIIGLCTNKTTYAASQLDTAVNDINALYNSFSPGLAKYLVAGETTIEYLKYYYDYERDIKVSEAFKYDHDSEYYDNSNGKASFDGQWMSTPITKFDQVGRYKVSYTVRDRPKPDNSAFWNYDRWSTEENQLELFVHRRPIADFYLYNNGTAPATTYTTNFDALNQLSYTKDNASVVSSVGVGSTKAINGMSSDFYGDSSVRFIVTVPDGVTDATLSYYIKHGNNGTTYSTGPLVTAKLNGSSCGVGTRTSLTQQTVALPQGTSVFIVSSQTKVSTDKYGTRTYYGQYWLDNVVLTIPSQDKKIAVYDMSMDLDHQTETNKGIINGSWYWKYVGDAAWISGYPTTLSPGQPVTILRNVQDVEGEWGSVEKTFDTGSVTDYPVANFTISKTPILLNELAKVRDTSTARSGSLTTWHWIIKRLDTNTVVQDAKFTTRNAGTGALAGYDANVLTNYSTLGVGAYQVFLRVKDSNGRWSDGGTDAAYDLNRFTTKRLTLVNPPTASFTIENTMPIKSELLKLKDTSSTASGTLTNWQWIVVKRDTGTTIQNSIFTNSNAGTGELGGFDTNVITNYSTYGTGYYDIYLRVKDSNGNWSDGGTDGLHILANCFTRNIYVRDYPIAQFTIAKNPLPIAEPLKLKDTSYGITAVLGKWQWIVVRQDTNTVVQNAIYTSSNAGTGTLAGYDANVLTDFNSLGTGIYKIYLRVNDNQGLWSDGGTDTTYYLDKCYNQTLTVIDGPVAQFTIDDDTILTTEQIKIQDRSYTNYGNITAWQWIVENSNSGATVRNITVTSSNAGTGAMLGYDTNVMPALPSSGPGTYKISLRVKDNNGLWSDGGTDGSIDLSKFYSRNVTVVQPPAASFTIAKNPINTSERMQLKDTSYARNGSLTTWHWIVMRSGTVLQNTQYANSNNGTGTLAGYDGNVLSDFSSYGNGNYDIYLRVKDSYGHWSDGGNDITYNLSNCYKQTLVVAESYKLKNFQVVIIRDLQLESYYKDVATGTYPDKPIDVNGMGIDGANFGISSLTKGYMFEFTIETLNFNEDTDTIEIVPHFYTTDLFSRDAAERDLYWEDSKHQIWKAGQGGHTTWYKIVLTKDNRKIIGTNAATWRGEYLIPGTAWAVPKGTLAADAESADLKRDIIVNFYIRGYKAGTMKFDYNAAQWGLERTRVKYPYEIGDVIKYSWNKSLLDDIIVKDNR